ncbi:MAG TPA: SDR family oxidoreductase [Archaeoglobaceae archaeon]|nr:SDR family oxidoreductase [Archaeoglobaceae archaeon]
MMETLKEDLKRIEKNLGDVNFEDQNVLVTGGAGFLGSWICHVLVEQNARVKCIDNLVSGLESNISDLMSEDNFEFIRHDISQPVFLDGKIDIVMHLASRASPLEFDKFPIQIIKANTLGTWIALGIAKKHRARLLFTSTSEVYGDAEITPTPETYNGNVNPVGIRGCYDESKRAGEAICMAYARQHGIDIRIARIFNTYGPLMRSEGVYGRVIPRFIDQALRNKPLTIFGDGTQTRSFCYVTDQIEALMRLCWYERARNEVVNIGNPVEITVLELAGKIKELTKSDSEFGFYPLPPDDPKKRCPDIGKAKKILGWEPVVDLENGLSKTIEWFRTTK